MTTFTVFYIEFASNNHKERFGNVVPAVIHLLPQEMLQRGGSHDSQVLGERLALFSDN